MKEASLGAGIRIHTERLVVLPVNVESPRDLQESGSTVRLAFLAARLIPGWIPGACDFAPFGVERNLHVIAFVRHEHAVTPLFGDDRHPISGEIVRGSSARGSWRSTLGIRWALRSDIRRKQQRYRCGEQDDSTCFHFSSLWYRIALIELA